MFYRTEKLQTISALTTVVKGRQSTCNTGMQ